MKNLKTVIAVMALIILSGAVYASGNLRVNIFGGETEKALVNITNASQSQYEIEIKNDVGDMVFYKMTKSPEKEYTKLYDLSDLDDGRYYFTVKLESEEVTNILEIERGEVKILNKEKEVEPYFIFKNDRLDLSYLNHDLENVTLYLYDTKDYSLLYEKDLGNDFALHHAIDLSKLRSGLYEAMVVNDYHIHEFLIEK